MQKELIPILFWTQQCRLCHAVIKLLKGLKVDVQLAHIEDDPDNEGWVSGKTFISKDDLPAVPALWIPETKQLAIGYKIAHVAEKLMKHAS